jgi:hypothetical protein
MLYGAFTPSSRKECLLWFLLSQTTLSLTRLKILDVVFSSMPTYFLTVFALKKWVIKRMDKLRHGFLWKGSEVASGGHYLVQWNNVQKPKSMCVCVGGGGVLELERFHCASRLQWLWFQWTEPDRPWVGTNPLWRDRASKVLGIILVRGESSKRSHT